MKKSTLYELGYYIIDNISPNSIVSIINVNQI
jgi:hypothetical protein